LWRSEEEKSFSLDLDLDLKRERKKNPKTKKNGILVSSCLCAFSFLDFEKMRTSPSPRLLAFLGERERGGGEKQREREV
jgi:hypothetical protein